VRKLIAGITLVLAVTGFTHAGLSEAEAQSPRSLVGTVKDAVTGAPLAGAMVSMFGSDVGTQTDSRGKFRLTDLAVAEINVRVAAEGYVVVVDRVEVSGAVTTVDFELDPVGAVLDELIVRDSLPRWDSVVTVTVTEPEELEGSVAEVLGRVPGVLIVRPGARLGAGTTIQIRGLKSLLSGRDPLVYLDGIRVHGGSRDPIAGGMRRQGLLDMIPLSQIDRIEILKGPAAAARYGLGAANGVILIHSKKSPGPNH
jgi:iron complex outermembrane receptor protein